MTRATWDVLLLLRMHPENMPGEVPLRELDEYVLRRRGHPLILQYTSILYIYIYIYIYSRKNQEQTVMYILIRSEKERPKVKYILIRSNTMSIPQSTLALLN